MEKFEFTPERGYEEAIYFPDPTSEEQTRSMMMEMPNQLKDFVNNKVIPEIELKANKSDIDGKLGDQVKYELIGNVLYITSLENK